MKVIIEFDTDNAAFECEGCGVPKRLAELSDGGRCHNCTQGEAKAAHETGVEPHLGNWRAKCACGWRGTRTETAMSEYQNIRDVLGEFVGRTVAEVTQHDCPE